MKNKYSSSHLLAELWSQDLDKPATKDDTRTQQSLRQLISQSGKPPPAGGLELPYGPGARGQEGPYMHWMGTSTRSEEAERPNSIYLDERSAVARDSSHPAGDGRVSPQTPLATLISAHGITRISPSDSPRSSASVQTAVFDPQNDEAEIEPLNNRVTAVSVPDGDDVGQEPEDQGQTQAYADIKAPLPAPDLPERVSKQVHSPYARDASLPPIREESLRSRSPESLVLTETAAASSPTLDRQSGSLNSKSSHSHRTPNTSSDSSRQGSFFSLSNTSPATFLTEVTYPALESSPTRKEELERSCSRSGSPSPDELRESATSAVINDPAPAIAIAPTAPTALPPPTAPTKKPRYYRQRSRSLTNAYVSEMVRRTREPGGRFEPHDVRRLDGIEVANGIELATQNTDGNLVPELEAAEISQLPTPKEAQLGPGLEASVDASDHAPQPRAVRAASPPPPPNVNKGLPQQPSTSTATTNKRDGDSRRRSQSADGAPSRMAKVKFRLVEAAHTVRDRIQGHDKTDTDTDAEACNDARVDLVPKPEVIRDGSIPEAAVVGPPTATPDSAPLDLGQKLLQTVGDAADVHDHDGSDRKSLESSPSVNMAIPPDISRGR